MDLKNYELAVALRHALHRHPELSNHETWTKAYLINFLDKHTSLEIVDRGAWFYAKYSAAPGAHKIAFRADFDALPIDETISLPYGSEIPGVSHKCGHDGHSATLAAFALEVDQRGAENTIYFIFQHAEETGDGAKECAVLVTEEGIEEVYGYHNQPGYPVGEVIVNDGTTYNNQWLWGSEATDEHHGSGEFCQDRKREHPQKFLDLEIPVLHITLDEPLHLVLQRFSAGLAEMDADDIGGVVHLHGEAAVLLVVGPCGFDRVVVHLHTSIKMGDTPPDASLCVILNDDSDDK